MQLYLRCTLTIAALLISLFFFNRTVKADSPPNISDDIAWTDSGGTWNPATGQGNASFRTIDDIEMAFNHARRAEEDQLGLPNNCLGNLNLANSFLSKSNSERALILMNKERQARAGLCGTDNSILGKQFEAVEYNIQGLAQSYANFLVNNNTVGHTADGTTPYDRIAAHPDIGDRACNNNLNGYQFLPRAENIASVWTGGSQIKMPIERAIFAWIYADSGLAWGHREMVLLQNTDLTYDAYGFTDDYGQSGREGFIGIGFAESPDYDPYNWGWVNRGTVVVLKYFDPQPASVGCDYIFATPTAVGMGGNSAEFFPTTSLTLIIIFILSIMLLISTFFATTKAKIKQSHKA